MKKAMFSLFMTAVLSLSFLAAVDYQVKSVNGLVRTETRPGVWEKLYTGSDLTDMSQINVGLNSTLVIQDDMDHEFMISPMQKGVLKDLLEESRTITGISLGGSLARSRFNTDEGKERTNISTASTRASDALGDLDWADER